MNEKIIIKNFSVIDEVEIDIRKINILIGPQSTGKSLIAKLVYFFRNEVILSFGAIHRSKKDFINRLQDIFEAVFPFYILAERTFTITYHYPGGDSITITNQGAKSLRGLKISFSEDILKKIDGLIRFIKKTKANNLDPNQTNKEILDELNRLFFGSENVFSIFIPAGRSFFYSVERNTFRIIYESLQLDYIFTGFGTIFQDIKNSQSPLRFRDEIDKNLYRMYTRVLSGEYEYDFSNDWIKTGQAKKIQLKHSSSGQQEALPLLVSLLELSKDPDNKKMIFVEEPEAHLFPESQRIVVEMMARIYNLLNRESAFFITTHSPYILTAFNNLIQAGNSFQDIEEGYARGEISAEEKEKLRVQIDALVGAGKRVDFDHVSAYTVSDGRCVDIRNLENRLIDANAIDEVSGSMAFIFDQLLDIAYGD